VETVDSVTSKTLRIYALLSRKLKQMH